MSTNAPADLFAFRRSVMAECGFTDPNEVGIKGDEAHAVRGGYHISTDDIAATGRLDEDFSTRRSRDHFLPNQFASAVDIGDNWPIGGRAAWLRFNNNVLYEMIHHAGVLTTVRAINCSTDGSNRKRYDKANADQGVINSTDTVTIHTHLEWWRDTNGRRAADLARLLAHVRTAIYGEPLDGITAPPPTQPQEATMIYQVTDVPAGSTDCVGTSVPENAQCEATPAGPFAYSGTEFFSLPAAVQPNRMKITWARLQLLCNALRTSGSLSSAALGEVKTSAHDGAQQGASSAIDGATITAAAS